MLRLECYSILALNHNLKDLLLTTPEKLSVLSVQGCSKHFWRQTNRGHFAVTGIFLIRVLCVNPRQNSFMKFIKYSKFKGLDVSSLNLGDLMEVLSDSLLSSGYDDDYYWTRERRPQTRRLMRCVGRCSRR